MNQYSSHERDHFAHDGAQRGFLVHAFAYQAVNRVYTGMKLAAAKDFGSVHIPRGQIRPSATPFVFVLDLHRTPRLGRLSKMDADARLDTGLLIGRYHELVRAQFFSIAHLFAQVQHASGLHLKLRVARKDPATVLPTKGHLQIARH